MEVFDGLVFDNDSYFNYMTETSTKQILKNYTLRAFPSSYAEYEDLTRSIYFLLRSAATLAKDASEEAVKAHEKWRDLCMQRAQALAFLPEFISDPPLPTWAVGAVNQVRNQLRQDFPRVDDIKVVGTLDPRLYVRSYHASNQIRISLLFRELLRTMNLGVWNLVDGYRSNADWRSLSAHAMPDAYFFPYFLPLYRDIPWDRLPMIRSNSEFAYMGAMTSTRLQMTFMIAHEFSHLLLHDAGVAGNELEVDADKFAYDVLFRDPGDNIKVGDVWMSTRWLFEMLEIEKTISWRLSGSDQVPARETIRRETLLFPFARAAGPALVDIELGGRGLKLLANTRAAMIGLSAKAMRERAQQWRSSITGAKSAQTTTIAHKIVRE